MDAIFWSLRHGQLHPCIMDTLLLGCLSDALACNLSIQKAHNQGDSVPHPLLFVDVHLPHLSMIPLVFLCV